ncbi:DUF7127 family protein [Natrarchaeobius oligotrophus]|uniref:Hsp20/alpha crystallin family protein n=1 Tax=Natrarchaeobius chitinivorans TaxID=1679083 RepID=A0A3N6PIU8_NATCH|nr:hypothetical protein [Natrarchaeobius chitinivorans]RQH00880.1 hypothetical protein EA472_09645 [Natrarchaeobius chitinivorans]
MNVPDSLRNADRHGAVVRTLDHGGESAIVVDFGPDAAVSSDVVGSTVIVVADDRQFEFELPAGATAVSARNGVLTVSE